MIGWLQHLLISFFTRLAQLRRPTELTCQLQLLTARGTSIIVYSNTQLNPTGQISQNLDPRVWCAPVSSTNKFSWILPLGLGSSNTWLQRWAPCVVAHSMLGVTIADGVWGI